MTDTRRYSGYIPRRTKEVIGPWPDTEGSDPFCATIVTSLSFAEIEAIPLDKDATFRDLFAAIAPYVVQWNALGRSAASGGYEPLPPPAEAGPDIFRSVDPQISTFLALMLKTVHFGDQEERSPKSTPSDDTPDGLNGIDSDSTPETHRKSRKATT